mgnify:CR=1 FL=1
MARRVLLTGAGGRIGTAFREYVGDRYSLRLVESSQLLTKLLQNPAGAPL